MAQNSSPLMRLTTYPMTVSLIVFPFMSAMDVENNVIPLNAFLLPSIGSIKSLRPQPFISLNPHSSDTMVSGLPAFFTSSRMMSSAFLSIGWVISPLAPLPTGPPLRSSSKCEGISFLRRSPIFLMS